MSAAAPLQLVLLHGFLGSPADWQPLKLDSRAVCHTPALPGHGLPPAPWPGPDGEWAPVVDHLARILDGLPRPRVLAGYSLGGRLALATAMLHEGVADALVLLASSPGLEDGGKRRERRIQDRERAARLRADLPGFLDHWYRQPLFGRITAGPGWPALHHKRLRASPEELARALEAFSPGLLPAWTPEELARLALPVLVMTGAEDTAYRVIGRNLARSLPRAEHRELPGVAHALLEEDPAACRLGLLRFLERHFPSHPI
jgi:2-succinyl-6-hydroxy-2,4-cyclohexadiene-1-carboxylate synthase